MLNCMVSIADEGKPSLPDDIQLALREAFPEAEFHELISWRMKQGSEPKKPVALLVKTGEMPEYGWQLRMFGLGGGSSFWMWDGSDVAIHSLYHMPAGSFWEWLEREKGLSDSGSS